MQLPREIDYTNKSISDIIAAMDSDREMHIRRSHNMKGLALMMEEMSTRGYPIPQHIGTELNNIQKIADRQKGSMYFC